LKPLLENNYYNTQILQLLHLTENGMKVKLAEALLRRKELQKKVDFLRRVNEKTLYKGKAQHQQVTESLDDIMAQMPKLKPEEVTATFNWHARQLRLVDAAIQQANRTTEIQLPETTMADFETKK
jgi:3-methyladenine DNA glycosylase AlkC